MLTISFEASSDITLHVGEKLPVPVFLIRKISRIQLDEDELVHVLNNMVNLPHHKTERVQYFYGDVARQIVHVCFT